MNITLIYASNSGSNYEVGRIVASVLSKNHAVRVLRARDANPSDIEAGDMVILGSPSWTYQGAEGMPPEAMMEFIGRCQDLRVVGKPFAIFGCGETAYTHFCGAVGHLEDFVARLGGESLAEPLRIDGYFFDEIKNASTAKAWAEELAKNLSRVARA